LAVGFISYLQDFDLLHMPGSDGAKSLETGGVHTIAHRQEGPIELAVEAPGFG
jgi:hypothetical protein